MLDIKQPKVKNPTLTRPVLNNPHLPNIGKYAKYAGRNLGNLLTFNLNRQIFRDNKTYSIRESGSGAVHIENQHESHYSNFR